MFDFIKSKNNLQDLILHGYPEVAKWLIIRNAIIFFENKLKNDDFRHIDLNPHLQIMDLAKQIKKNVEDLEFSVTPIEEILSQWILILQQKAYFK